MVRQRLVFAPMPFVFGRVFEKVPVELLDMVLGEINGRPVSEDAFHRVRIAAMGKRSIDTPLRPSSTPTAT